MPSATGAPPTDGEAQRRSWRPSVAGVMALALAVWGLAVGLLPLSDNSFLTHLATGRVLLDSGIPRSDPFSFTAAGEPWVVQSWLAAALYGVVDQWWGATGLLLLWAALTVTLALLVIRLARPAEQLAGRLLAAALVIGVGSVAWGERPLLIGLVLLAVTLVVAEGGLEPRWLVPTFWVWANVHGSFPLGLVVLAALALGRRLDGSRPTVELRALRWAAAGVALAAVNPLGPRLLVFPLELLARADVLRQVVEWQAPTFTSTWQRLFLVQLVLAVIVLVRRPSYRAAIPLVLFSLAGLLAMRNLVVASIVLLPGLARGLQGLGRVRGEQRPPAALAAAGVLVALAGLLVARGVSGDAFRLDRFPQRPLAWMQDEGMLGDDSRVVAPDFVGNYREAVEGRSARVFLDDRFDMYPTAVIEDYLVLQRGEPAWDDVLRRHGTTAVLWEADEPLASLLRGSDDWRLVHADASWVVAVPRSASG